MADYTKEQMLEAGRKFLEAQERDAQRTKAAAEAVKRLKAAHKDEYDGYYKEALKGA